jgi:L-amino acid N-acyltransferase YncA
LAASFLLSSILNFFLAVFILKSPPGTAEFNAELGKMTALSYPVIVIPSMVVLGLALWKLLSGIKALTGLQLEEIFNHPEKKG